jgi:hypothetical protein
MYRDKRERFLRVTDRVDEAPAASGSANQAAHTRIKPVGLPGQRMPLPQADDDIYLASADGTVLGLCRRGWLVHRDTA